MRIGIFDSGLGGHLAAAKLRQLLPEHDFMVVDDHSHVPYGNRSERDIIRLATAAIRPLLEQTRLIVIACNTVTAVAIDTLRESHPQHLFVGYEPMLKPFASMTQHGIVLATTATRHSARYQVLKQAYVADIQIDEPDTLDWASLIENNKSELIDFSDVAQSIADGADVISLSCTHYLVVEQRLRNLFPKVRVIEPTEAVARRIQTLVTRF